MIHVIARGIESGYIVQYEVPHIIKSIQVKGDPSEELNLSGSDIVDIKDNAFKNVNHIKSLNLSKNELSELRRSTFAGLTNLENLDLSRNLISKLSVPFAHLRSLKHLNLSSNIIVSPMPADFFGLPKSCVIRLEDNYISSISQELLGNNYHLILD